MSHKASASAGAFLSLVLCGKTVLLLIISGENLKVSDFLKM